MFPTAQISGTTCEMLNRLITQWVYGGALAGVLLLLLAPLIVRTWSPSLTLVFLHLPLYMFHQYEEHDNDRFRLFLNKAVGDGKEVLTPLAVFVINVLGVWGLLAVSTYLAADFDIGLGLIAVYLVILNGVAHVAQAILLKSYNPGLATAIVLFLPVGGFTLWRIQLAGGGQFSRHAIGMGVAVAIHLGILATVRAKRALSGRGHWGSSIRNDG
jgi:Protein of unknown function with HXXEE motif